MKALLLLCLLTAMSISAFGWPAVIGENLQWSMVTATAANGDFLAAALYVEQSYDIRLYRVNANEQSTVIGTYVNAFRQYPLQILDDGQGGVLLLLVDFNNSAEQRILKLARFVGGQMVYECPVNAGGWWYAGLYEDDADPKVYVAGDTVLVFYVSLYSRYYLPTGRLLTGSTGYVPGGGASNSYGDQWIFAGGSASQDEDTVIVRSIVTDVVSQSWSGIPLHHSGLAWPHLLTDADTIYRVGVNFENVLLVRYVMGQDSFELDTIATGAGGEIHAVLHDGGVLVTYLKDHRHPQLYYRLYHHGSGLSSEVAIDSITTEGFNNRLVAINQNTAALAWCEWGWVTVQINDSQFRPEQHCQQSLQQFSHGALVYPAPLHVDTLLSPLYPPIYPPITRVTAGAGVGWFSWLNYNGQSYQIHLIPIDQINPVAPPWNTTLPTDLTISPAFPNPFNSVTCFNVNVPFQSELQLTVYDLLGRLVDRRQLMLNPGNQTIRYDASQLASGSYFTHFSAGRTTSVRKLTLLR